MPKDVAYNIDQDIKNEMNEENSVPETENFDGGQSANAVPMDNAGQEISEAAQAVHEIDPLDTAKQEIAELKDKYLRLYADFENFRRRTSKEKLEMLSTASSDVVRDILPVVDDFERAKLSFESSTDILALKEGVELIFTKLVKTLEAKGLKPMEAKGTAFDADIHESIAQFPAPTDDLKGKVIDEIEKGYYLNDKVIRFAKVIVGA